MLRARVIPSLLLSDGGLVKTTRFKKPVYLGDPINIIKIFNDKQVDELVLLDIQATPQGRGPDFQLLSRITNECFMPLGYGGGIRTVDDARALFSIGVEKVIHNTMALEAPELITRLADKFGSQSIVASVDVRKNFFGKYEILTRCGSRKHRGELGATLKALETAGAGEIYINSIDRDGTMQGYDLEMIKIATRSVNVPVIASGGAGKLDDFAQAVNDAGASAVAAGSFFCVSGKTSRRTDQRAGIGAIMPTMEMKSVNQYRVCNRCVMDTTEPDIVFDQDGHCNHCNRYYERAKEELHHGPEGAAKLQALVEKIKLDGRNKPYDCIIGVSGGVDSTMVAYRAKQLGLRPLAIHLDNAWNSELSVANIEKTLKTLNIDLYTHVMNWEEFKNLQLAFLKASVPNMEIPTDHAITALLFAQASKYNIRYILSGSNLETEGIMPRSWTYDNRDFHHLASIHKRFGSKKLRTFPHYSLLTFAYYLLVKRIKFVKILNYAPFRKKEVEETIKRELGWTPYGGKHFESIFTRFYQGYILPQKFGFDKRKAHYSTLICSGQMTREEAFEQLKNPPYPNEMAMEDREYVIKKFGLTDKEFDALMTAPPKAHTDYPSLAFLFLKNKFGLLELARRIVLKT